jgi:hypothetical protein
MSVRRSARSRYSAKSCCQALHGAVVASVLLVLAGCGGVEKATLNDYLDNLEFNTQMESLKEVPLGSYKVSAATRTQEAAKRDSQRTWVQITCKLYVIVAPEDESSIAAAYEQHRGIFDDTVVQIFRNSTIDELSDPRWTTIKSRISDFARPILGGERVRQIVLNDFGWEPI